MLAERVASFVGGLDLTLVLTLRGKPILVDPKPVRFAVTGTVARAKADWLFANDVAFDGIELREGTKVLERFETGHLVSLPAGSSFTDRYEVAIGG